MGGLVPPDPGRVKNIEFLHGIEANHGEECFGMIPLFLYQVQNRGDK
jgi:hypothetical protein